MPFYNRLARLSTGDLIRAQIEDRTPLVGRIGAYRREHALLKERYRKRGMLRTLDARCPLDEVTQDVLDALGNPEGLRYHASQGRPVLRPLPAGG